MANKTSPVKAKDRFGRLTVLRYVGLSRFRNRLWECRCICGKLTTVVGSHLASGNTVSCGCLSREANTTHGMSRNGTPEYRIWTCMIARCSNREGKGHHNYGGRGIKVCERWLKFENFYKDMGPRPSPKHSIDRVNNDGDYEPSNCRWATKIEQDTNRRTNRNVTYKGRTQCITFWARELGIHPMTLMYRLDRGWTAERTLTTPVKGKSQWTKKLVSQR